MFASSEWEYGLRCMSCNREFVEGQPIAERLEAMTEYEGEPAFIVELVCVECSLALEDEKA